MSIGSVYGTMNYDDDLFKTKVSVAHTEPLKGVTAQHLSKVWIIDIDLVKRMLDVTTKRCKHDTGNPLVLNHSTNDRMLRYRHINTHFFTDTFFVTKKAKSSRNHTSM